MMTLILSVSLFCVQTQPASAVSATDFNASNIIDDAIFYSKDAMTLEQIEAFIKAKTVTCDTWGTKPIGSGRYINGVAVNPSISRAQYAEMMRAAGNANYHAPPYVCLSNYYENPDTKQTSFDTGAEKALGMLSAAEIIYRAAQTYGINPQVLLVTLKKEYGYAFTDDWPLKNQYNTMMGYACPDNGPGNTANCSSKYYGFYNQVINAAWQFNYYKQNITKFGYQPYRNNYIQYSPDASCGGKQVYIENMATASLYNYTPYTPNPAALAAYPGTAPCGAYGNRNFFMFFNEWFGSTTGPRTGVISNIGAGAIAIGGYVTNDGIQHVVSLKSNGEVFETWWGNTNGSYALATSRIANIGAGAIAIGGYVTNDGIQHVVSLKSNGEVFETWWGWN